MKRPVSGTDTHLQNERRIDQFVSFVIIVRSKRVIEIGYLCGDRTGSSAGRHSRVTLYDIDVNENRRQTKRQILYRVGSNRRAKLYVWSAFICVMRHMITVHNNRDNIFQYIAA